MRSRAHLGNFSICAASITRSFRLFHFLNRGRSALLPETIKCSEIIKYFPRSRAFRQERNLTNPAIEPVRGKPTVNCLHHWCAGYVPNLGGDLPVSRRNSLARFEIGPSRRYIIRACAVTRQAL